MSKQGVKSSAKQISTNIRETLFSLQDIPYRDFQKKLIPNIDPEAMIGIRTPDLRALARKLKGTPEAVEFLSDLPHRFFDENQLHAFLISEEKDYDRCIGLTETFLPYVDNWATCDQLSPKVFKKHKEDLLPCIGRWLESGDAFTVRFGIGMLMQHYLDEAYDPAYPELVAGVESDEYYVRMMVAWYFATALAKQYDGVIAYLEEGRLDAWTHNKTIQKAVESRRISPDRKVYLKSLRINLKERLKD